MKIAILLLLAAISGLLVVIWVVPYVQERVWEHDAQSAKTGILVDDLVRKLGPGEYHKDSHFQRSEENDGVTHYLSWSKSGYELEVGVMNGKVKTLRQWFLNF